MDRNSIFDISNSVAFERVALQVFHMQAQKNAVYKRYLSLLKINHEDIHSLSDIPFLPIQFFKSHTVIATTKQPDIVFESSGTTGDIPSSHHVADLNLYSQSFNQSFAHFYGAIEEYAILALLPSYLERQGSSLVYMVNELISRSNNRFSGFYLADLDSLKNTLKTLEKSGQKTLLIGVSFALLDLADSMEFTLKNTIVMETGGMKGRRKELVREELHERLCKGFGLKMIHSEYGMTELLSQAYSKGNGIFYCPAWMKIIIRDTEDALSSQEFGKTGGINVVDLANLNSCSFIATQDLGKSYNDGSFEVLGRFDNSDIRGCNLMI